MAISMYKTMLLKIFIILLSAQPAFSEGLPFSLGIDTSISSKKIFPHPDKFRSTDKGNSSINLKYGNSNFSSQISLNFNGYHQYTFDKSYVSYRMGIATFGIGTIDRHWSFSDKSSLILSSNARPLEAVSLNLKNKFNVNWLPKVSSWSLDIFNGSNKQSKKGKDSMLFGSRLIITPFKNFDFELIQTSQYGGDETKINSSTIGSILLGNSNEGRNSETNKMAGFGFSYLIPIKETSYRIYSQAVGEDEAGGLPSCYGWLNGLEISMQEIQYPTSISIEFIDTRVKTSAHGFCGPNTMYTNNSFDYTNYGTNLGAPIDTEGTSLGLFGETKINSNLSLNYSTNLLTINDKNYLQHRISSKKSTGSVIALGMSWEKNGFKLNGNISYQNIDLDKVNISNGTVFGISSSIIF